MFLRNLWNRTSQQDTQLQKYDKIVFEININQNIPQFCQQTKIIFQEDQQITPNHPQYYQIYKKNQSQQQDIQIYTTNHQDDSIGGLALKLNISQSLLKSLNKFSGQTLFPNMKIKIPANLNLNAFEQKKIIQKKPKISQLFLATSIENSISKYQVFYCAGSSGNIFGTLTLNINYIMFNPSIQNQQNKDQYGLQKLLKFFAIIEIQDIKQVLSMDIPEMTEQSQSPKVAHIMQLLLFKVGNKKVQEKYKQRLKKLKMDSKAIASISFKSTDYNHKTDLQNIMEISQKIKQMINKSKQNPSKQSGLMTNIPYYDILYDSITQKQKQNQNSFKRKRSQSLITSRLNQQSMLPQQAYLELASYFPGMEQLYNWSLLYSCFRHGSSFQTLLRLCNGIAPLILMIKQYKGNILGAFIVDTLQKGKSGRGQMFIWKYVIEEKKFEAYGWTQKNSFFCFIDSDGIGIGMGSRYGIFIKNTLDKGHSGATDTFGNTEKLSVKQQFEIQDIEIWHPDDY